MSHNDKPSKNEMAKPTKKSYADQPSLNESQVRDYLKKHPNFLSDHPDILLESDVPFVDRQGEDILDFQLAMIAKLKGNLKQAHLVMNRMVDAGIETSGHQSVIFDLAVKLCEIETPEDFQLFIKDQVIAPLDLKDIALFIESDDETMFNAKRAFACGFQHVPSGTVSLWIQEFNKEVLHSNIIGDEDLFGAQAEYIHSMALVPLTFNRDDELEDMKACLFYGAEKPTHFQKGQGTDLLYFLSRMIFHTAWRIMKAPQ